VEIILLMIVSLSLSNFNKELIRKENNSKATTTTTTTTTTTGGEEGQSASTLDIEYFLLKNVEYLS